MSQSQESVIHSVTAMHHLHTGLDVIGQNGDGLAKASMAWWRVPVSSGRQAVCVNCAVKGRARTVRFDFVEAFEEESVDGETACHPCSGSVPSTLAVVSHPRLQVTKEIEQREIKSNHDLLPSAEDQKGRFREGRWVVADWFGISFTAPCSTPAGGRPMVVDPTVWV